MSDSFKASNGWYIDEDGVLREANGRCVGYGGDVDRLGGLFQELRDHELGRWRDPENPKYVVYRVSGSNAVRVLKEETGDHWDYTEGNLGTFIRTSYRDAAERYFAAHPQHKPLPTEPGMYTAREEYEEYGVADILVLDEFGKWCTFIGALNAKETAQRWHDAGELVRLVPEGSDDE